MRKIERAVSRRLPVGAEVLRGSGVEFRVWSPGCRTVAVVLEGSRGRAARTSQNLEPEGNGYFSGILAEATDGTLYRFRLDDGEDLLPDPASRFQPEGPFGPSQVIDPGNFRWTDTDWPGVQLHGQVMYEIHFGTFTQEGTWESARRQLPELAKIGVTLLEMMPVADFPGKFGWGYDGVNLFAPTRLYGVPDDFRRFIDEAHKLGIGAILDVVYNHVGGVGDFLGKFSPLYFSQANITDWGKAINYDGEGCGPVREFIIANAGYWIDEFHCDGFRIDATQSFYDESTTHILAAVTSRVREVAGKRGTIIIGENEPQHPKIMRPAEKGGYGMDAVWDDDFHHTAMVALTGRTYGYYHDYLGTPQEFISSSRYGYLYQGQRYPWQKNRRGAPALDITHVKFVHFLQNHDQIANTLYGLRCHDVTSPGRYKALTALLLLGPETPMLFQGQEFAASSPFHYFSDMPPDAARLAYKDRVKFLHQFKNLAQPEVQSVFINPNDPEIFRRSKLDLSERKKHAWYYNLHRDLLMLRRKDPVFRSQGAGGPDGAVLGPQTFLLRFFGKDADDRLLLVNLGRDLTLEPAPEPLLAPPEGKHWHLVWSSEDPRYGGTGTPPPEDKDGVWHLIGEATTVLKSELSVLLEGAK